MIIGNNKKINKGSIYKTTKYLPFFGTAKVFSVALFVMVIVFFRIWLISCSKTYIFLSVCSLIGFFAFFWPILLEQKVQIKEDKISFTYRIGIPFTVRISESLYQIVMKNGKPRSFRFKGPGALGAQVSPDAYIGGEILSVKIMEILKKKRVIVQIIEK